ncbi:Transcriptional regulator of ribosomal biogenesis proteins, partial [Chytridiales sp. JEL 0842]
MDGSQGYEMAAQLPRSNLYRSANGSTASSVAGADGWEVLSGTLTTLSETCSTSEDEADEDDQQQKQQRQPKETMNLPSQPLLQNSPATIKPRQQSVTSVNTSSKGNDQSEPTSSSATRPGGLMPASMPSPPISIASEEDNLHYPLDTGRAMLGRKISFKSSSRLPSTGIVDSNVSGGSSGTMAGKSPLTLPPSSQSLEEHSAALSDGSGPLICNLWGSAATMLMPPPQPKSTNLTHHESTSDIANSNATTIDPSLLALLLADVRVNETQPSSLISPNKSTIEPSVHPAPSDILHQHTNDHAPFFVSPESVHVEPLVSFEALMNLPHPALNDDEEDEKEEEYEDELVEEHVEMLKVKRKRPSVKSAKRAKVKLAEVDGGEDVGMGGVEEEGKGGKKAAAKKKKVTASKAAGKKAAAEAVIDSEAAAKKVKKTGKKDAEDNPIEKKKKAKATKTADIEMTTAEKGAESDTTVAPSGVPESTDPTTSSEAKPAVKKPAVPKPKPPILLTPRGEPRRMRLKSLRVIDPETGTRRYVCPCCHKEYKNANGIKYHLNHVHLGNYIAYGGEGDGLSTGSQLAGQSGVDGSGLAEGVEHIDLLEKEMLDKVMGNSMSPEDLKERPFACDVAGCGKTYKNLNGLKYHTRNAHQDPESTASTTPLPIVPAVKPVSKAASKTASTLAPRTVQPSQTTTEETKSPQATNVVASVAEFSFSALLESNDGVDL